MQINVLIDLGQNLKKPSTFDRFYPLLSLKVEETYVHLETIVLRKMLDYSSIYFLLSFLVMDSNSGADGSIGHRMSKNGSSALGYTPDLTSGVHNEYNYTYSDKNSNCSSQKGNTHSKSI